MQKSERNRFATTYSTWKSWNWNIKMAVLANIFASMGFSIIYFGTTFLIKAIGGEDIELGTVGFFSIIATLVITILSGIISDRWRRDFMIKLSILLSVPGVILLSTATSIEMIIAAQMLIGASYGMSGPPINAIIADSIKPKERVHVFGTLFAFALIAGSLGNVLGWGLLQLVGDEIEIEPMHKLLQLGMFFILIASFFNFMLSDEKCPDESSQEQTIKLNETSIKQTSDENNKEEGNGSGNGSINYSKITPYVIVLSGLLIGFGAGLSIPFLPYFFESHYKLDLSELFLVFAVTSALTGVLGKLLTSASRKTGIVKMVIFTQGTAVILLLLLATYPPLSWALTIYLVRNAFMNSSGPLVNGLLMSSTKKETRARWTAINQLSWSLFFGISQMFGGIIIEASDYWVVFLLTASFYFLATIIIPLIREK
ncbi:MAG: MFS transporter [Candidatus Kariarchaeaceae archaeon]